MSVDRILLPRFVIQGEFDAAAYRAHEWVTFDIPGAKFAIEIMRCEELLAEDKDSYLIEMGPEVDPDLYRIVISWS